VLKFTGGNSKTSMPVLLLLLILLGQQGLAGTSGFGTCTTGTFSDQAAVGHAENLLASGFVCRFQTKLVRLRGGSDNDLGKRTSVGESGRKNKAENNSGGTSGTDNMQGRS